jgi:hypothetical protein
MRKRTSGLGPDFHSKTEPSVINPERSGASTFNMKQCPISEDELPNNQALAAQD